MKLSKVKDILPNAAIHNFQEAEFSGIAYDSRQVKPNFLFVALKGEKTDGHKFIPDAIQHGCAAVVVRNPFEASPNIPQIVVSNTRRALAILSHHFYNQPSNKLSVIGITGTNGKTTVAYLIRAILEAAGHTVGQLGTISYFLGEREIPASITTPESVDLQGYLAEMVRLGISHVVMEVSSHALVQNRVYQTCFTSAVFTTLGRDHLDYHKTPEEYRKAKSILFKQLSPESSAILNRDDPASSFFQKVTPAKILWYGSDKEAEVTLKIEDMSLDGMRLIIRIPDNEIPVTTSLIGKHNAYNILAAVTGALSMGIKDPEIIRKGIDKVTSVRGRLEKIQNKKSFNVIIDYAHTPDALLNVLTSLKSVVSGRIILVFGCGGDRDKGKRPLMGKIAKEHADLIVLTSDNPRSEKPFEIIKDIEEGIGSGTSYYTEPDRRGAIEEAFSLAQKDDVVLITGKGHETYQIFHDTVKPFDDRAVVQELLKSKQPFISNLRSHIKVLL